jgi:hypothetical protein
MENNSKRQEGIKTKRIPNFLGSETPLCFLGVTEWTLTALIPLRSTLGVITATTRTVMSVDLPRLLAFFSPRKVISDLE